MYGTPGEWDNIGLLLEMLSKVTQCRQFVVTLDQFKRGEIVEKLMGDVLKTTPPFELRFGRGDEEDIFFGLI
jgi:hypothetical protein